MRKRKITVIFICCLICFPFGARAEGLEPIFQTAAAEAGISVDLVKAIAKHESSMNPNAVNVAGRSYYPNSREDAERIIEKARKAGKSFDVGLMQINRFWHSKWGIEPESLLDPETNIRAGIKILVEEMARHGSTWKAVGAYHSPCPQRGYKYACRIFKAEKGTVTKKAVPKKAAPAKEKQHVGQDTGFEDILLYRRGFGNCGQRGPCRIVRF